MRQCQLAFFDIPDLNFADASWLTTRDGESFSVGREPDGLNPFRQADETIDEAGAIRVVQQHFVKTGDGQQLAIGREIERRDHRRQ